MKRLFLLISFCLLLLCSSQTAKADSVDSRWYQKIVNELSEIPWREYGDKAWLTTLRLGRGGIGFISSVEKQIRHHLFAVRIGRVSGYERLSEKRVRALLPGSEYLRLIEFVKGSARARLLRDPWVNSVNFRWTVYPTAVEIEIVEEEPWIVAEYNNDSWLIARSGKILESLSALERSQVIVESSDLSRLRGITDKGDVNSSLAGSNVRLSHAIAVLKVIDDAGGLPFVAEEYELLEDGALRILPREAKNYSALIIGGTTGADVRKAIAGLRVVEQDLINRGQQVNEIDLRFDNRAVVR